MSHGFHKLGSSGLSIKFNYRPLDAYAYDMELLRVAFLLQVSVGTLLAFTMVAISVLILRYVPPDEVPLPSSLQESIDSVTLRYSRDTQVISGENPEMSTSGDSSQPLLSNKNVAIDCPVVEKQEVQASCKFLAFSNLYTYHIKLSISIQCLGLSLASVKQCA